MPALLPCTSAMTRLRRALHSPSRCQHGPSADVRGDMAWHGGGPRQESGPCGSRHNIPKYAPSSATSSQFRPTRAPFNPTHIQINVKKPSEHGHGSFFRTILNIDDGHAGWSVGAVSGRIMAASPCARAVIIARTRRAPTFYERYASWLVQQWLRRHTFDWRAAWRSHAAAQPGGWPGWWIGASRCACRDGTGGNAILVCPSPGRAQHGRHSVRMMPSTRIDRVGHAGSGRLSRACGAAPALCGIGAFWHVIVP